MNNMSIILPRRPIIHLPFLLPSCSVQYQHISKRHESSARRTTKRLRNKPDPSSTAPFGKLPPGTQDHIVFNPPSSAPSPYHTPPIFLPANDPRRRLLAQSHSHANPYQEPDRSLPPPVRKPYDKKYHLNHEQVAEIRRLRSDDPFVWTRAKLAEKFDCSQFFIGMVCEASKERKEQSRQALENVKARWGKRRQYAREDRTRRRELWGRDE